MQNFAAQDPLRIHWDTNIDDFDTVKPWENNRVPIVYYPDGHTLAFGMPGQHHYVIEPWGNNDQRVFQDHTQEGILLDGNVQWFDHEDEIHPDVKNAVTQMGHTQEFKDDDWRFGAASGGYVNHGWFKGNNGKGFLTPDGTFHIWPEDYATHYQMAPIAGYDPLDGWRVHVDYNGNVEDDLPQGALDKLKEYGFGSNDGWTFSKTADNRYDRPAPEPVPGIPQWVNGGHFLYEDDNFERVAASPWTLEQPGKGFILDGRVHTWATDNDDPYRADLHHDEIARTLGSNFWNVEFPFQIDREGKVTSLVPNRLNHENHTALINSIPKLHIDANDIGNQWSFSKVASHFIAWSPGNEGKGLFDQFGRVHTWNVNELDGSPTHWAYRAANPIIDSVTEASEFWISKGGEVSFWQPNEVPHENRQTISEADPRLKITEQSNGDVAESGWTFSKVSEEVLDEEDEERFLDQLRDPLSDEEILELIDRGHEIGSEGKALGLPDETEVSWNTEDSAPHHDDVLRALGIKDPSGVAYYYVDEMGNKLNLLGGDDEVWTM